MQNKKERFLLWVLILLEGASVMNVELVGAKMIAPFYGSSLYVWASVLGITLLGLAIGYFAGGIIADRSKSINPLFYIILLSGVFIGFMPISSEFIMTSLISWNIFWALLFSCFFFLFPPLVLLGMSSPIVIANIAHVNNIGKTSGSVYALSTIGGLLSTFLMGFYIIPTYGLKTPIFCNAIVIVVIPVIFLIKNKSIVAPISILVILIGISLKLHSKAEKSENFKVLYSKEGLLGQLTVADINFLENKSSSRVIFNNHMPQTALITYQGNKIPMPYVKAMGAISNYVKDSAKTLILGLGGGTLYNMLSQHGHEIDAVEFDQRMVAIARKYFNLKSDASIYIQDGRNFINSTQNRYDLIVVDLCHGESFPGQIYSKEAIKKMKTLLNSQGIILFNFYGFLEGSEGVAGRSLLKTIKLNQLEVEILATPGNDAERNLIFIASKQKIDFSKKINSPDLQPYLIDLKSIDSNDFCIFTDDLPTADLLSLKPSLSWRKSVLNSTTLEYYKKGLPIFN